MRILIAAGGTGGHVYPAVALAEELVARGNELNWVGRPKSLEETEAKRLGIPFVSMPLRGFKRKFSFSNLTAILLFWKGRRLVLDTLNAFRPHLLFALGSYVSAPAISAGLAKKIPVIVHEQNVVPGLVVRLFARKVTKVALTRPLIKQIAGSCEVVGLPLRPGICLPRNSDYYNRFGLSPDKKTLLVFGGSQGATSLCSVTTELAKDWEGTRSDWQILLQTGKRNFDDVVGRISTPNLTAIAHITDMGKAYACADVIVARSGATSCEEIAAVGKPAVLVPYPYATSNHQEMNARAHLDRFPGEMILEDSLNLNTLDESIDRLKNCEPNPKDPEERDRPLSHLLEMIAQNAKGGGKNGNCSESAT